MTVTLIGERGARWQYTLPLHPVIAAQVEKGLLVPATAADRRALDGKPDKLESVKESGE